MDKEIKLNLAALTFLFSFEMDWIELLREPTCLGHVQGMVASTRTRCARPESPYVSLGQNPSSPAPYYCIFELEDETL